MSTTTATRAQGESQTTSQRASGNMPAIAPPRLPYHPAIEERFGIGLTEWRALVDAVFPLAKETGSIIMALAYCRARKLDPFKKPVHIVPMWNGQLKRMVETVWPGIGELRTTAFRTGQFAGRDEAKYGETRRMKVGDVEIEFPEWCQVTVYRMLAGQRVPFPGPRVYWMESYATAGRDDASPNSMWRRRPFGQIDKCAEAAALRAAFPEEVGNEYAAEEMEGRVLDGTPAPPAPKVQPIKGLAARMDALAAPRSAGHDPDTGEITNDAGNGDQNADDAGSSSEQSPEAGGESSSSADVASGGDPSGGPAWGSPKSIEQAREEGASARRAGKPRRALPSAYHDEEARAEAEAWEEGWDSAAPAKGGAS